MVSEHELDDLLRGVPPAKPGCISMRVTALLLRPKDGDECLPQGPPTAAAPGGLIQMQSAPNLLGAVTGEERPGHHQVAGGVTHGRAAEVDDPAQSPIGNKQVRAHNIPVHPDSRVLPRAGQGRLPHLGHGVAVNLPGQQLDWIASGISSSSK